MLMGKKNDSSVIASKNILIKMSKKNERDYIDEEGWTTINKRQYYLILYFLSMI